MMNKIRKMIPDITIQFTVIGPWYLAWTREDYSLAAWVGPLRLLVVWL